MTSCTVTAPLHRHGYNAEVSHVTPQRDSIPNTKEFVPDYIEIKHIDKPTEYYLPSTILPDGEQVMQMQIPEVTVTAKARTLPERLGKVDIDFVVTLPKELQGNCRSIIITPVLHNQESDTPLQDLAIRGGLFYRVQERNYWQFGRYMDVYRPDSIRATAAFSRFVKFPVPIGVRLDSVVEHPGTLSYHYTQEVATAEAGKQMLITLAGKVLGIDRSRYILPVSDTLVYNISSMLTFADTSTRYRQKIIRKYVEVRDRNYLSYKLNDANIIDSLADNVRQLSRIETLMDELINQQEYYVDSIVLTASSSPEGTSKHNMELSRRRAHALYERLNRQFADAGIDTLLKIRWSGEDWPGLIGLVGKDDSVKNKSPILELCRTIDDPDQREEMIRHRYPDDYAYIRDRLYPLLRAVDFRYALRRVDMVEDTVYTTEPDTLYARGVELLRKRQYAKALYILAEYKDRNTAITLLSLGYNESAYETLRELPESAVNEYLTAIACARLDRIDEGRRRFERACGLENRLKFRANLDPEIMKLKESEP